MPSRETSWARERQAQVLWVGNGFPSSGIMTLFCTRKLPADPQITQVFPHPPPAVLSPHQDSLGRRCPASGPLLKEPMTS